MNNIESKELRAHVCPKCDSYYFPENELSKYLSATDQLCRMHYPVGTQVHVITRAEPNTVYSGRIDEYRELGFILRELIINGESRPVGVDGTVIFQDTILFISKVE